MVAKVYTLNLPLAAVRPEISFRSFAGESDYPNLLACINASKAADGVERSDSLEDIQQNYAHLHHCDPYTDMLIAERDGQVVGYNRAWWDVNAGGEWIGYHLAFIKPEARRQGIGTTFSRFAEGRFREMIHSQRAAGQLPLEAPCMAEVMYADGETGKEELLQKEGYTPIRHFFSMVRPDLENLPDAPLPAGLEVRPVTPEQHRQVWDAFQEAFRDHWGYTEPSEEDYEHWLVSPYFQPDLWKIAWDGDQVAGMVLNFILEQENTEYQRKRGYTEGIAVRRPWRKRGLARALIVQSLQMHKELGLTEAALGVDSENLSGALHIYESVGFKKVKHNAAYRKPL